MAEIRPEVVDFIFDQGRAASGRQLRDADSLDAKATQLLQATKYAMVVDMAAGFDENEHALGRKRRGVLAVLFLTGVETALIGAAVIDSLWG